MKSHLPLKAALTCLVVLAAGLTPAAADEPDKPEYQLIYYDGHMHTTRSDGNGTIADIKETALSRGLDAVIVTDHCEELTVAEWQSMNSEAEQLSDESFLVIPAFEITGQESMLNRDHILAYRATDPFVGDDALEQCPSEVWPSEKNPEGTGTAHPENLTKWVDYVRSQGGFAVHAHTFGTTRLDYGVTAIEVYNQSAVNDLVANIKLLGYDDAEALRVAMLLSNTAVYGERDLNTPLTIGETAVPIPLRMALSQIVGLWLGAPEAPLISLDELFNEYSKGGIDRPVFAVAGTDTHNTGSPESEVGVATTGVYVESFTPESIFSAIERGRGFATTGPFVDLRVNGRMMGQTATAGLGGVVEVEVVARAGDEGSVISAVRLTRDFGTLSYDFDPDEAQAQFETSLDEEVDGPTYYRMEVTARDPETGRESYAWSNPVFVRCPLWDGDCDGYLSIVERLLGSYPREWGSRPEHTLEPGSCDNGQDDDNDGSVDGEDSGCRE